MNKNKATDEQYRDAASRICADQRHVLPEGVVLHGHRDGVVERNAGEDGASVEIRVWVPLREVRR